MPSVPPDVQLTAEDLDRLAKHNVPIDQWPEQPDDLIDPDAFTPAEQRCPDHA